MKARPIAGYLLVVVFAAAASLSGAPSEADLDWIAGLEGVSVFSQKTTSTYSKTVYSVSGSPDATFETVQKGLSDRGWTIQRSRGSALLAISARSLTAQKGESRVKIVLSQLGDANHLSVELTPGRSSARTPSTSEPGASKRPQPPPATGAGTSGDTAPPDKRTRTTYDCGRGDRVSVNASSGAITVQGRCGFLVVNGSSNDIVVKADASYLVVNGRLNTIRVDGAIDHITTNGDENTVTWSPASNPGGPRINDLGRNNTIHRY